MIQANRLKAELQTILGGKMNKQNLDGRVAVVTGASTGIGSWAAIALAECGAAVAVNYNKNQAGAEATKRIIESQGGRSSVHITMPRSAEEDVRKTIRQARSA